MVRRFFCFIRVHWMRRRMVVNDTRVDVCGGCGTLRFR